jgi:integrase
MTRTVASAVKRAGLSKVEHEGEVLEEAPTFHCLRHTHASKLIRIGWDPERVSRRLGHANTAFTLAYYVHEFEARKAAEQDRSDLDSMEPSMEAAVEAQHGNGQQHTQEQGSGETAL